MAYFVGDFVAGERPGPVPFSVETLLWSAVVAVGALGVVCDVRANAFPWLAAFLTPVLSGLVMTLPGDRDGFSAGLWLGGATSAVFLLGAGAAWGYRRWVRIRRSASHR